MPAPLPLTSLQRLNVEAGVCACGCGVSILEDSAGEPAQRLRTTATGSCRQRLRRVRRANPEALAGAQLRAEAHELRREAEAEERIALDHQLRAGRLVARARALEAEAAGQQRIFGT